MATKQEREIADKVERDYAAMAKHVTDDPKTIGEQIKSLKNSHDKFVADLDVCAASIVCFVIQHGNVNPITQFVEALGGRSKTAIRTNAFLTYFERHAPCKWDKEAKKMVFVKARQKAIKAVYAKDKLAFAGSLLKSPAYEENRQPEYQGVNLLKLIGMAVERTERDLKRHADDPKKLAKINAYGLAEAKTLVQSLRVADAAQAREAMDGEAQQVAA